MLSVGYNFQFVDHRVCLALNPFKLVKCAYAKSLFPAANPFLYFAILLKGLILVVILQIKYYIFDSKLEAFRVFCRLSNTEKNTTLDIRLSVYLFSFSN